MLTNGTIADATAVMGNFNAIVNCVNANVVLPRGYLGGLAMSNDGASPNLVIDTAAGVAASDDATVMMQVSAFTKSTGAWAAGSGNGCLDTGTVAASTWYHLYVIENTNGPVIDELCSTSATSPSMPTGYTKKRRVGSFRTNSSNQILTFVQNGDEFLWAAPSLDMSTTTLGTTATLFPLTVPPGVKVNALLRGYVQNTATGAVLINSPDETSIAGGSITTGNATFVPVGGGIASGQLNIRTDTSRNVRAVAQQANTDVFIVTYGWVDSRGRFN